MATFTFKDKKAQKELPVPNKKRFAFKNLFYRGYMVITVILLAYIAIRVS
jgi:hypothetical protein